MLSLSDPAYLSDANYQAVSQFLEGIPLEELSEASFNCKGYTRALMYFEHHITSTKQDLQEHLDFLQVLIGSHFSSLLIQRIHRIQLTVFFNRSLKTLKTFTFADFMSFCFSLLSIPYLSKSSPKV